MPSHRARKLIVGAALSCAACVVQPPPPQPVAVANPPPPQNCREYNAQIMIDGQPQPAYGWACQQPDGSWKISQEAPGKPPQVYIVPANPAYPPGYPYWAYDPYWGPRLPSAARSCLAADAASAIANSVADGAGPLGRQCQPFRLAVE